MQNFGGQTKIIMVYLTLAYNTILVAVLKNLQIMVIVSRALTFNLNYAFKMFEILMKQWFCFFFDFRITELQTDNCMESRSF